MNEGHVERLSLWRRAGNALVPVTAAAVAAMKRIEVGEKLWITVDRRRSVQQHRLFFAILTVAAEATEYETADRLLVALKLRLGKFDLLRLPGKAEPVPVPHSVSFAAMKQDEFQKFFDDCMTVIFGEVLAEESKAEVLAECQAMLNQQDAAA